MNKAVNKAPFIEHFDERGLLFQKTPEIEQHLQQSRNIYIGFDPTADSLHVGSLVPLLALRRAQLLGHRPFALVGGATGLIGDPSFKDDERSLNSAEVVAAYVDGIAKQIKSLLDFDRGSFQAQLVNNIDWMSDMNVLTFLRDVGKHFSINAMIQKESVKARIDRDGQGISFTEFSYLLLQSYDFLELSRRHQVSVQLGGSDQWGNITGGIDLVRRVRQQSVYAMTMPLVTKSDGTKFGKTNSGAVWLSAERTSVYAFYQFWINTTDEDVLPYLNYFTFLTAAELSALAGEQQTDPGKRIAQRRLAEEVTRLVHGEVGLTIAKRISEALFRGEAHLLDLEALESLHQDELLSTTCRESGLLICDALVQSDLAGSKTQARKLIAQNGVSVNGEKVTDAELLLNRDNALYQKFHVLKKGKKAFGLIYFQS